MRIAAREMLFRVSWRPGKIRVETVASEDPDMLDAMKPGVGVRGSSD